MKTIIKYRHPQNIRDNPAFAPNNARSGTKPRIATHNEAHSRMIREAARGKDGRLPTVDQYRDLLRAGEQSGQAL